MNNKLQKSYESIVGELNREEIEFFKIGITHDIEEREKHYRAEGYSSIYPIATGDNKSICRAESDLINALLSDKRVSSKCENTSAVLGLGQTQLADCLYVAVCIHHKNHCPTSDLHLEDVLFTSGFPIIL